MTTFHVRGAGGANFLTWILTNDKAEIATARKRLTSDSLEIDIAGRRVTARIKDPRGPTTLAVVEDRTGTSLMTGKLLSSSNSPEQREWAMELRSGTTLSWFYQGEPRKLGYFEPDGKLVMDQGRDPSFDTTGLGPSRGALGMLRILFRFWGAAVASSNRYLLQVADGAVGPVVTAEDIPVLALLGVWLQADVEAEADSGGMAS
jgi:hypothetical protein